MQRHYRAYGLLVSAMVWAPSFGGTAVTNLHKLDAILPAVKELGKRHKGYGVSADQYAPVGAAPLWTLEKGLGPDFTPDTKAAWTEAYTALAGVMANA
jgi:hemoglobin-like flavoprotein